MSALQQQQSVFLDCIDGSRLTHAAHVAEQITSVVDDFASDPRRGRGTPYLRAQIQSNARRTGIEGLLSRFETVPPDIDGGVRIVDLLGGDGLIARVMNRLPATPKQLAILTSDVSDDMVRAAIQNGLPAVCQAAQCLALRSESVHGALLAYGTHHIPASGRAAACAEAFRAIKPGGRMVLHDYASDSGVAHWFRDVVHRYSRTGHDYAHFTETEIHTLLSGAGFSSVAVSPFYDPLVFEADTDTAARTQLAEYLLDTYGLSVLVEELGRSAAIARTYELADEHYRYDYEALGVSPDFGVPQIVSTRAGARVRIECPRVAIVGMGTKPVAANA